MTSADVDPLDSPRPRGRALGWLITIVGLIALAAGG